MGQSWTYTRQVTHHDQIQPVLSALALLYQLERKGGLGAGSYEQTIFSPVQSRTVDQAELTHSGMSACHAYEVEWRGATYVEAVYHYIAILPLYN